MTREEQIRQEIDYQLAGSFGNYPEGYEEGFIEGAKWADENPNKKLVYTKKELLDIGFAFDLNGNISTQQEIEEKTKKYINYQKDKWIDKACNWLEQHQESYDMYDAWSGDYVNFKSLIMDFRKAMEEQV